MVAELSIPLVDLQRQYEAHKDELDEAVRSCVESSRFVGGFPVRDFERSFAEFAGTGHAAACANGTDALYLALVEILGRGDGRQEIITVAHTFVATVEAIVRAGYEPVLVDVEPDTLLMDLHAAEAAVTEDTVAIVPVHLYGQMVDMDRVMEIAERSGLNVIEDAAQAHGASRGGIRPGQTSDAACFSFYPGKNLGAWGDGGAVVTSEEELARRIRMRGNHGRSPHHKYEHEFLGTNSRLDSIQAAVLTVKLQHLERWNEARRSLAARYTDRLDGQPGITTPTVLEEAVHAFHLYVVRVGDRDRVLEHLRQRGIGAGVHYPVPVHRQPACSGLEPLRTDLEATEEAAESVLSLPLFPELRSDEVDRVVDALVAAVGDG